MVDILAGQSGPLLGTAEEQHFCECKSKEQTLCSVIEYKSFLLYCQSNPKSQYVCTKLRLLLCLLCVQDYPVSKTSQIQGSGAEGHGCFWTDDGLGLCEQ